MESTTACAFCLEPIITGAAKCPHCTSEQPWVAAERNRAAAAQTLARNNFWAALLGGVILFIVAVAILAALTAPPSYEDLCQKARDNGMVMADNYCLNEMADPDERAALNKRYHFE